MDSLFPKICVFVLILLDGLFFGHLPLLIKMYTQRKSRIADKNTVKSNKSHDKGPDEHDNGLLISFLNCYAAGIFFATCILHMLPEISEKMKNEILKDITGYPVAELIVGTGFFFVLSLEQIVLGFCVKKSKPPEPTTKANSDILMNGMKSEPVIMNQVSDVSTNSGTQLLIDADSGKPYVVSDNKGDNNAVGVGQVGVAVDHEDHEEDHSHFDPAAHSTLRLFILVGALALHAVFEGLVFGISRESPSKMVGTVVAVIIHKSIIAFSTGMQLLTAKIKTQHLCMAIILFSVMAPIGLVIGIIISAFGADGGLDGPMTIIEAVATGTFIYVTFLELVPHEFMGDVEKGPLKVLVMALGFATMAAFQAFDYDIVFMNSKNKNNQTIVLTEN